ncbi:MAG: transcription-repair coupling factor, partial [Candidatus Cloacimonetes bacterium]|nr:transcription-repair coupling factor [Candidatus Cloacimonadota bacterium]
TLYMSATPIPRTMYMALSRLKDLSLIRTSPKERLPIRTVIVPYDQEVIKDAISREVDRGGQVFFIHNRVQTIDTIAAELRNLLPGVTFGIGHGQLPEKLLEQVTLDFAHHQFDVLIATTIIESGIDIPNVNTIIINRADTFGLAQLYQIRGRVGRSNRRAYAYLIIPPQLSEDARKRLETLIEYESLGSGYQIAMRDMELRGVGALLGTKQHGIINTIGFNHYTRLLEDAVEKLRSGRDQIRQEAEKTEEHVRLQLESDFYFPEYYISDEQERLNIYRRMLNFEDEQEFHKLKTELEDRFGKLPEQAENSLLYYHLRLMIRKSGLASFRLKQNVAIIEFSSNQLPSREKLEKFVQHFAYPIQFSSTKNLKISVELSRKNDLQRSETINKSLEIVNFLTH